MKNKNNIPPLVPLDDWRKQFTKEELEISRKKFNYDQKIKYYKIVQNLKKIRKELGLTQQQVADKANIHRSVVAKVETGQRNAILNTLMTLANALGKELKIDFV